MTPAGPPVGPYVGSGCLVVDDAGRYLLVRETKAIARGRWSLPAGKLEPGESIVDAAMREVLEETGLTVEVRGLLGVFHCALTSENSYGVNFVFEARAVGGELTISDEHPELVWYTSAEVEVLLAQGELRGAHAVHAIERSEAGRYLDPATVIEVGAVPPVS